MFKSIKSKLVASFLVSISICIVAMAIIMSQIVGNTITKDFVTSTENEMIKVEEIVGTFFTEMKNNSEMLAQNETIKKADETITSYIGINDPSGETLSNPMTKGGLEAEIYKVYENFAKTHPSTADAYFGTVSGGYVQYAEGSVSNAYDPRERPWYKEAMANQGEVLVTDAYYWAGADAVNVSIVKTVEGNSGEVVGVQSIDIALSGLTDMISKLKIGKEGYVIIVEGTGNILSHPTKPDLNFKNIEETYLKDLGTKQSGSVEFTDEGEKYITNIHTSSENGWKYISVVPKSELVQKTKTINTAIIFLGLAIMIISIAVSIFISNGISKPIQKIRDLMKEVEGGNFNVKSEIKGKDEVSQLGNSFNAMTENVKSLIRSSKHISENIEGSSDY